MIPLGDRAGEDAILELQDPPLTAMDAIARGTADGVGPLVGIITSLLVMVALVTLINGILGEFPMPGGSILSLQNIFAFFFRPVMWAIGIDWSQTAAAAHLMGTKTVLNELVAYLDLAHLPDATLTPHVRLIMIFALCGFANFGSLGIMIGGLGAMVPSRRHEVVELGLRSILSGTMATCLSAAVAGILS